MRRATRFVLWTLGVIAVTIAAMTIDEPIATWFRKPLASGQAQATIESMRAWGEASTIVLVIWALWLTRAIGRRRALCILLACLLAGTAASMAKPCAGRLRPADVQSRGLHGPWHVGGGGNSSFPSGHVATAFAFARSISMTFPAIAPVAAIGAVGTAASRMLDQRHFLSDCIAGSAIGWWMAGFVAARFARQNRTKGPIATPQETFRQAA